MKFNELTSEQQKLLTTSTDIIREYSKHIARIVNQIRIATAGSGIGELATVLQALDVGEKVPNTTGMVGARDLTREQILQLLTFATALSDIVTDSVFGTLVDAVGPQNVTQ